MNIRKLLVLLALGLMLFVAACGSAEPSTNDGSSNSGGEQQEEQVVDSESENQTEEQTNAEPAKPTDVKANAATWLAEQMNIPAEEITPFSAVRATFKDTCLEIPKEGETCEAKQTKGWKIFLQTKTENILVHASEAGTEFRSEALGGNTADPSAGGSKP